MASEHLMKASPPSLMVAAHTPFLVVELHIVHTTPFSLLQVSRSPDKCNRPPVSSIS